jgi:hypothetical protein
MESLAEEIEAMKGVAAAVRGLDKDAVNRVLSWAISYFDVAALGASSATPSSGDGRGAQPLGPGVPTREDQFLAGADVGDLFAVANPTTESARALLMAYWMQEVRGEGDLDAQRLNTQLKHLGHGVTNITRALEDLIGRTPKLVIQVRKSGSTKQARKRYKVTHEGIKVARAMLAASHTALK